MADNGKPSDVQARKARANALRASIEKLEKDPAPKPSSPREVTDEAAAKARAEAEKRRRGG